MKVGLLVSALAAALVFVFPIGAGDAATVGGCSISGSAHFTPGLKTAAQAVSYTVSGKLSNCKNNTDKTATSSTVRASGSGAQGSCSGRRTLRPGTLGRDN